MIDRHTMKTTSNTQILIESLEVMASIGVHPHEYETTQPLIINMSIEMGHMAAPVEDRLSETLDYSVLADKACELAQEAHVQLVETLAHRIAHWTLEHDNRVVSCTVHIRKPHALINAQAAAVNYTLTRAV